MSEEKICLEIGRERKRDVLKEGNRGNMVMDRRGLKF